MDKTLPCYSMEIDPNESSDVQVDFVALVDLPAIEKNFLAFNEQPKRLFFEVASEDRRIISGPAMLANVPIFRTSPEIGDYYVTFSAETIYDIAQKFFLKGFNQNFNLMHNPEAKVDGVTIFESFIVDKARGIQPMKGFEDAADGSWFISAKVNNDAVWQKIKNGELKGFSVEGLFQYKKNSLRKTLTPDETLAEIHRLLKNLEG